MSTVRFDEATREVAKFLESFSKTAGLAKLVAIRDLTGRYRFAVEGEAAARKTLEAELVRLEPSLGRWLPEASTPKQKVTYGRVLAREELFDAGQVFDSKDLVPVADNVFLLDRRVIAADWQRGLLPNKPPLPPRATFFAVKGGAGRSTALVYWVRHLARDLGKRVLVVDLDLESPGVSAALLPRGKEPRFGVVDWYVEDGVGQVDDDLLSQITAESPIASGTPGSVHVAPVAGGSSDYLAKLARVYGAPPGSGDQGAFGERTGRLIDDLEAKVKPDVTVIDSRAGLHDVGAVSVVRLGATAFLFATATEECWLGYRYMFEAWGHRPEVVEVFREKLQTVASLVPETEAKAYTNMVRERAHELFSEWIYEGGATGRPGVVEPFNFNVTDAEGPHNPVEVRWNLRFFAHDPLHATVDASFEALVQANFGAFLARADELVLP